MSRSTAPAKNRLTTARLKKSSLLPKRFQRPSDATQAREWLHSIANHLSNFPNAGPPVRFAVYAIKKYLRGSHDSLDEAFNLMPHPCTPRKQGNQPVSDQEVRTIAKMLTRGANIPAIMNSCGKSQTTVTRVKTEWRVVLYKKQGYSRRKHGDLREREWRIIERRSRKIDPPGWRKPIIQGIADAIAEEGDLLDKVDAANPFVPLPVDPLHKPELVHTKLK